jgi:hypothetical protein
MANLHDYIFGSGQQVTEDTPSGFKSYWKQNTPSILDRVVKSVQSKLGIGVGGGSGASPTPQSQYLPSPAPVQQNPGFRIKVPSSTPDKEYTNVPQNLAQIIGQEFDPYGQATSAASILHHPYQEQQNGYGYGENAGFVTGKGWDDYNRDESGQVKLVQNPFTKQPEPSEDRGLFRINNSTFYDYQKRFPNTLKKAGITSFEDMYDPDKNIKMARLIFEKQGWGAWFAAPKSLVERK